MQIDDKPTHVIRRVSCAGLALALMFSASLCLAAPTTPTAPPFAELDRADSTTGYLARLLINETSFPGERAFVSEADSKGSMLAVLWVLHGRIQLIPQGYRQSQVAGVSSSNIIDVITGGGGKRQCEGFYLNAAGKFVTAPRVEERIQNLLSIANRGGKPGRFAGLLNYAQGLARAYVKEGIEGVDRFAGLKRVGNIEVTGRAYSWMTDVGTYHPGGNYVSIPSSQSGSLAGNRFFTLRKVPK
jgi:hypothetical protein